MTSGKAFRLALLLVSSQALLGCGGSTVPVTPASPSYTSLTGNWNLSGNRALTQYPLLALTLIVNGNQVSAKGDVGVQCTNLAGSVGGSVQLSGQIATDGTFALNESVGNTSSIQIAVTGTVPAAGASTWTGTYSITDLPGYTSCIVDQNAAFTADALMPLDGTYAGTLSYQTSSVAVSLNVSQQPAIVAQPLTAQYVPLKGTITIAGSPCFTHGASSTISASGIQGDNPNMVFVMDDGSQLLLFGTFTSPTESTLGFVVINVIGGLCNQSFYSGTLIRQ